MGPPLPHHMHQDHASPLQLDHRALAILNTVASVTIFGTCPTGWVYDPVSVVSGLSPREDPASYGS
jgi:hypothetical protein